MILRSGVCRVVVGFGSFKVFVSFDVYQVIIGFSIYQVVARSGIYQIIVGFAVYQVIARLWCLLGNCWSRLYLTLVFHHDGGSCRKK